MIEAKEDVRHENTSFSIAQLKTARLGKEVLILHMPFPEISTNQEWGSSV